LSPIFILLSHFPFFFFFFHFSFDDRSNQHNITTTMAKQILILLAIVCYVAAQTMPTFPTEYYAAYSATSGTYTSTGDIYSDPANNRTRTDSISSSFTLESLSFSDGTTVTTYVIIGTSSCRMSQTPVTPAGTANCTAPAYQGTATVDNQNTQYWEIECYGTTGNSYVDMYWNGNVPVRIATTIVTASANISSIIDYTTFTVGAPDASNFAIPSICSSASARGVARTPFAARAVQKLFDFVDSVVRSF
jgi:hypothetical protein